MVLAWVPSRGWVSSYGDSYEFKLACIDDEAAERGRAWLAAVHYDIMNDPLLTPAQRLASYVERNRVLAYLYGLADGLGLYCA